VRVTESMVSLDVLRGLRTAFRERLELHRQLATGKKLNVPSDGPADAAAASRYRSEVRRGDQYERNAAEVRAWLEAQDSALGLATDALHRARELAVLGSSGTVSQAQRLALAEEAAQLFGHLVQVANTLFGGRYLFGGSRTLLEPFAADGTYLGDAAPLEREVAPGVVVALGLDGGSVLGPALAAVKDLEVALRSGDLDAVSAALGALDGALDRLLSCRAAVGARTNRVEAAQDAVSEASYSARELLAQVEDADLPLVATLLSAAEANYRAALRAGAGLVRVSLLDFLG